ncbi:MAG: hypothetical protein EOP20_00280 [Hyphomicrobiales bacterium]|nr:MAG: hypothetical protein EOP20_00280 [Hyphomicrobiales bacterium]
MPLFSVGPLPLPLLLPALPFPWPLPLPLFSPGPLPLPLFPLELPFSWPLPLPCPLFWASTGELPRHSRVSMRTRTRIGQTYPFQADKTLTAPLTVVSRRLCNAGNR